MWTMILRRLRVRVAMATTQYAAATTVKPPSRGVNRSRPHGTAAAVAFPDGPLVPQRNAEEQPRQKREGTIRMNQPARVGAAVLANVGGRHVFERDRLAGQHRPRLVRMRERHLEPDALG